MRSQRSQGRFLLTASVQVRFSCDLILSDLLDGRQRHSGRVSLIFRRHLRSPRIAYRAAAVYTLIQTAKLNDVDPQAWLADVLARINDHNIQTLDQLLPWNWKVAAQKLVA